VSTQHDSIELASMCLSQVSGRSRYTEATQKNGDFHFSWKPPLSFDFFLPRFSYTTVLR
jgi:hypothetical protein